MKSIIIVGAGSLGKETVWLIESINQIKPTYVILGFLDDDIGKNSNEYGGYRVLGTTDLLSSFSKEQDVYGALAIQNSENKKRIVERYPQFCRWENIIHPTAVIAPSTCMGIGNLFFPQAVISVGCKIGSFGLYSIHSSVANDCVIGDYTSIMQGATVSDHVEIRNMGVVRDCCYVPSQKTVSGATVI